MYTIHVRQRHIKKGKRFSVDCCPVALALKEYYNLENVYVCVDQLYLKFKQKSSYPLRVPECWICTPHEVRAWLERFDFQKLVQPFQFNLWIPE